MPNLRWSLSGTLMLLLLTVPTAMAADEPAATGSEPVVVSGTLDCDVDAAASPAADGSTDTSTASILNLHEWTASDPRLSGDVSYSGHWQLYGVPQEDGGDPAASDPTVYSIVNEGGSWLCETSRTAEPPAAGGPHTLVFNGEGDYEGLTAYLEVDFSQAPYAFTGLILQGDEPPYAEPQG